MFDLERHFETNGSQLVWRGNGETIALDPWGPNSVRVRARKSGEVLDSDWALLAPAPAEALIEIEGERASMSVGNIVVVLTSRAYWGYPTGYREVGCTLEFYNQRGELLFKELSANEALRLKAREHKPHLAGDFRLTASFMADPAEKLFGMGQYQQDIFDLKGCTLELAHRNSQTTVPFVLSDRGYGFLWHNPAIGKVIFAENRTEWIAESTKQLDYWVTVADTPAEVLAAYADATGHAPMMPDYGLGYWQCKLRYWNQEQLLEVAREHKRRGLPIDLIVADFFHWPHMGDMRFDEEFWPDPSAMVAELTELGIELMVSFWPQVELASENYLTMKKENLLVTSDRGLDIQMGFQGPSVFFDPTNPAARRFVWETCKRNYGSHGIRTFWLDESDPDFGVYDWDNYRLHAGPALQVGNLYPQALSRTFYDGRRDGGETEIVNLVRAAWAGSQRYGALVWSGDIHSTWDDFRRQLTAGLHMGIAGIPWFTTDIGGFSGGDISDPAFIELLIRWFQFGAFCPVMRMHGDRIPGEAVTAGDGSTRQPTGAASELWSFGDDAYPILTKYVRLREALKPYTRDLMLDAHRNGQPVMRTLFLEFPDDPQAWSVSDQYMFGSELLVAPILQPAATSRSVYLPAGARWTSLIDGTVHDGGRLIEVSAPLDVMPVFARDGSHAELVAFG